MKNSDLKIQQLFAYWTFWEENSPIDIGYAVLSTFGSLRHLDLSTKNLEQLDQMEINIRNHFSSLLEAFGEFTTHSTLLELAQKLQETPEQEDLLLSFYQHRHEIQLALQTAQEFAEEQETSKSEIIYKVFRFLEKVDDILIFNPELLSSLQEIGDLEEGTDFDLDFFWWIPREQDCSLPKLRQNEYISRYISDTLPENSKMQQHITSCLFCQEEIQMLKETLFLEYLQVRPSVMAAASTPEHKGMKRFLWQDEKRDWKLSFYLENTNKDSDTQELFLNLQSKNEVPKEANLQILIGPLSLVVSAEGNISCSRIDLQNALEQEIHCRLYFPSTNEEIVLAYKGESDE